MFAAMSAKNTLGAAAPRSRPTTMAVRTCASASNVQYAQPMVLNVDRYPLPSGAQSPFPEAKSITKATAELAETAEPRVSLRALRARGCVPPH